MNQYVQPMLDDLGLDSEEVFAGLPCFSHLHLTYSLIRRDRIGWEEEPVKLTVAGMAHLNRFASTVEVFLQVVNELADRRAAAPFEPGRVIMVEISWRDLVADLGLDGEPLVELLPELLQGEPATWHGSQQRGDANRAATCAASAASATSTTTSPGCAPGSGHRSPPPHPNRCPRWASWPPSTTWTWSGNSSSAASWCMCRACRSAGPAGLLRSLP